MAWVWIVVAAWVVLGVGLAVLISRSVALADRKAAEAEPLNYVVDRPPLTLASDPPEPLGPTTAPAAPPPTREPHTIPGLPTARPPVGRPSVPRSSRQRPHRRSGLG